MKLTKGDLVMTEHGLAIFGKFIPLIGYRCYVLTLGTTIACELAIPLSPEHCPLVEAYIKEKGWESIQPTYYSKGDWIVEYIADTYCVNIPILCEPDFDTAPAMQVEAILMARLLNATKD